MDEHHFGLFRLDLLADHGPEYVTVETTLRGMTNISKPFVTFFIDSGNVSLYQ